MWALSFYGLVGFSEQLPRVVMGGGGVGLRRGRGEWWPVYAVIGGEWKV